MILWKNAPTFTFRSIWRSVQIIMARLWFLIPIIVLATGWLYVLVKLAPEVDSEIDIHFPTGLDDLKQLNELLQLYYETNPAYVYLLFSSAYLYKQSFSIPGSVFLNVLGGALFGVLIAFPLCCLLTAFGASICFGLSKYMGKETVEQFFPDKVKYLQDEVERNKDHIVYYLLFLRLFPMSPSWLINLVSPVIEIPFPLFFITVTIGLMPYNFVCVQTGEMLASLTSLESIFSFSLLCKMALLALAALGPSMFLRRRMAIDVGHTHTQ